MSYYLSSFVGELGKLMVLSLSKTNYDDIGVIVNVFLCAASADPRYIVAPE